MWFLPRGNPTAPLRELALYLQKCRLGISLTSICCWCQVVGNLRQQLVCFLMGGKSCHLQLSDNPLKNFPPSREVWGHGLKFIAHQGFSISWARMRLGRRRTSPGDQGTSRVRANRELPGETWRWEPVMHIYSLNGY